jgi:ribosome-associated protein
MVPGVEEPEELEQQESKSARKRAAQAAQDLGEELIALPDSELDALDLPERLADAIREARRITSRAAGARQRQFIGKLMRDIDPEPIRAALAARDEHNALEAQRFKRLETWRLRLLDEQPAALDELLRLHPEIDRSAWTRRVAAAKNERDRTGAMGPASRELFRALRSLFESTAPDKTPD